MERVDVPERFIHHRRATYWQKRKNFPAALAEIELALTTGHAQLDALTLKASILIDADMQDDAARVLGDLIQKFPGQRHDVAVGLQCKSLTRQGKWREAMQVWQRLRNKGLPVHQGLLKAICLQQAEDPHLSLVEREAARRGLRA